MKTIHLIRHAKSSWKNVTLTDHQRPLNSRGKEACKIMAQRIWDHGCHFEHVYVSTAVRAQKTVEIILNQLMLSSDWHSDALLYTFEASELLHWLRHRPDSQDSVVIIAHNPAILELGNLLGDQEISYLPTCSYMQLTANISQWQALDKHCAKTQNLCYPKMFINKE